MAMMRRFVDVVLSWLLTDRANTPLDTKFPLCAVYYPIAYNLYATSISEEENLVTSNEFRRPVSVDFAPRGSSCEWCGKPAERQLTAIGGDYHNESGVFCSPCGEKFSLAVLNSVQAAAKAQPYAL